MGLRGKLTGRDQLAVGASFVWLLSAVAVSKLVLSPATVREEAELLEAVEDARDKPLLIEPLRRALVPMSSTDYDWLHAQMLPSQCDQFTPSMVCHLLQLHGLESTFPGDELASGRALVEALTDEESARRLYGRAVVAKSRWGVRARGFDEGDGRSTELHRDQLLATLARVGIPLSHPVIVGGQAYCVRDLLRDSVANFNLGEGELPWSALAYCRYLPPQRKWMNRYGEEYSFDDLAIALMDRPLPQIRACGGTHILEAVTAILRADMQLRVLSDDTRHRVEAYLRRAVKETVARQSEDGSFPADWNDWFGNSGWSPIDNAERRLSMTGHLSEWMMHLPEEIHVEDEVLVNAARWLEQRVKRTPGERYLEEFCPYSHAFYVLRRLGYACASHSENAGLESLHYVLAR